MGLLINKLKRILGNNESSTVSFSQCGEDRLLFFVFHAIGVERPSYLDIGAFDPFFINNTALFYSNGSRGINIEPNPHQLAKFSSHRSEDKNLCIGISDHSGTAPFYVMEQKTVSTFSEADAKRVSSEMGIAISETIEVNVLTLPQLIEKECGGIFPDLLSIDVEGLDLRIMQSLRGYKSLPKVICAETVLFGPETFGPKNQELIDEIIALGFRVYADTFVNTIFLRNDLWK